MDEDGRYCGSAGAIFHQVNIHWADGHRSQIFPEKGVRLVVLLAKEDELGNVDFDRGFHLTHTTETTMAKMIDRLYRVYPGLESAVRKIQKPTTFRVPGTAATN